MDGKRVLVAALIKTRPQLLGVNTCTFWVAQLLGKLRDAQNIYGRLRKIERILNQKLMDISFIIYPGLLDCTYARGCVAAPAYRGYLMACNWLQLSNKRLSVVTDMNVGAVVTNHGT